MARGAPATAPRGTALPAPRAGGEAGARAGTAPSRSEARAAWPRPPAVRGPDVAEGPAALWGFRRAPRAGRPPTAPQRPHVLLGLRGPESGLDKLRNADLCRWAEGGSHIGELVGSSKSHCPSTASDGQGTAGPELDGRPRPGPCCRRAAELGPDPWLRTPTRRSSQLQVKSGVGGGVSLRARGSRQERDFAVPVVTRSVPGSDAWGSGPWSLSLPGLLISRDCKQRPRTAPSRPLSPP